MSNINSWNIGEPAILSVLFPIPFIMSDIEEEKVLAPTTGEPCTDESCATDVEEAPEAPAEEEAPTETETPTAE